MEDQIYQDGVAAAKAGDMVAARKHFSKFVELNPESEKGWLALGQSVDEVEMKEFCFKKVLLINPDNFTAHNLLQTLPQSQAIDREIWQSIEVVDDEVSTVKEPIFQKIFSLPAIIGFVLGLIVVGGMFLFIVKNNPPAFFVQFARAIVPTPEGMRPEDQDTETQTADVTSSPTWTPLSTPSPTGDPFIATPSHSGSVSERYREISHMVLPGKLLMNQGNYAEAILIWDEVIRILPEFANAYYLRGSSYLWLTNNQRGLTDYIENSQKAYDDFTKAIELGPPRGEYYLNRAQALVNLSNQFEYRDYVAPFYQQSLEDNIQAYMLGSYYAGITRRVGVSLRRTGRCEEALDFFLRLVDEQGKNAVPSASINGGIADAYDCLGEFEKALNYIEESISILEVIGEDTQRAKWRQVQILIALERYNQAFEIINESIEESPHYYGWRYYERAYLYYLQGEPELAYQDLDEGSVNTWGQYKMRAYLLALLALEEGDEDSGLYWLQLAEASLPKYSLPHIYEHTLEEIDRLGGSLLYPTPTPSPTPVASPTPIPVVADHVYFTPTPASEISDSKLMNYSGTGIFLLGSGDEITFLFRPEGYHDFTSIDSLALKVTAEEFSHETQISSDFMLLDGSGFMGSIPLYTGENKIPDPQKVVSNSGYFYVTFRNDYGSSLVIEDISVQLIVKEADGTTAVYGYE
jgi:tetratricopeptide (TPR) repeat protein